MKTIDIKLLEKIAGSQFVWAIVCFILMIFGYRAIKAYILNLRSESQEREDKLIELYETQKAESKQLFKAQKAESKEREDKLMIHLDKTTDTLGRIDLSLEQMRRDIDKVNLRVDEVWTKMHRGKS